MCYPVALLNAMFVNLGLVILPLLRHFVQDLFLSLDVGVVLEVVLVVIFRDRLLLDLALIDALEIFGACVVSDFVSGVACRLGLGKAAR